MIKTTTPDLRIAYKKRDPRVKIRVVAVNMAI